jgi:hypothetical protein
MSARIATGAYSATAMLNLYRSIIRLHRKKLPPALRTMGNTYVRHEFDLHKKANLTQVHSPLRSLSSARPFGWPQLMRSAQVKTFARQWREYEGQMVSLSNTSENVGRHMTDAELNGGFSAFKSARACRHALDFLSPPPPTFPPQPWTGSSCIKSINLKRRPRGSHPVRRLVLMARYHPRTS